MRGRLPFALLYFAAAAHAQHPMAGRVLVLVNDKLGLVAIGAPDPPLGIFSRLAHIRAVHAAREANPAAAPDGQDSIIPRFYRADGLPDLGYLAEHLVPDDQPALACRRFPELAS